MFEAYNVKDQNNNVKHCNIFGAKVNMCVAFKIPSRLNFNIITTQRTFYYCLLIIIWEESNFFLWFLYGNETFFLFSFIHFHKFYQKSKEKTTSKNHAFKRNCCVAYFLGYQRRIKQDNKFMQIFWLIVPQQQMIKPSIQLCICCCNLKA